MMVKDFFLLLQPAMGLAKNRRKKLITPTIYIFVYHKSYISLYD